MILDRGVIIHNPHLPRRARPLHHGPCACVHSSPGIKIRYNFVNLLSIRFRCVDPRTTVVAQAGRRLQQLELLLMSRKGHPPSPRPKKASSFVKHVMLYYPGNPPGAYPARERWCDDTMVMTGYGRGRGDSVPWEHVGFTKRYMMAGAGRQDHIVTPCSRNEARGRRGGGGKQASHTRRCSPDTPEVQRCLGESHDCGYSVSTRSSSALVAPAWIQSLDRFSWS